VVIGGEHDAGLTTSLDDGLRVAQGHRQRLFAEHMLAGGRSGDRLRRVQFIGRADIDGIHRPVGEQVANRRIGLRDSMLGRVRGAAHSVAAHHRDDFVTRQESGPSLHDCRRCIRQSDNLPMRPWFEHVTVPDGQSWTLYDRQLPAFPFNWHYHPEFELTLTPNSVGERFVGDHVARYGDGGDLVLVGPNLPHAWQSRATVQADAPHRALVVTSSARSSATI
jgi:hypothetical protein